MKIPKNRMLDVLNGGGAVVSDTMVDTTRWAVVHRLVFRLDGLLLQTSYRVGATEAQDEGPWEYETLVDCVEVEEFDRVVTDWRPVPKRMVRDGG